MEDPLWNKKEKIIKQWYIKGKPILDVGCNEGIFLAKFKEEKFGIDIDSEALEKAKKRKIKTLRLDLNKPFNLHRKFFNIFCLMF